MQERRKTSPKDELVKLVKYFGATAVGALERLRYSTEKTQQNLILLESFHGTRLECNPLAIYNALRMWYPGKYRYVWVAENPKKWSDSFDSEDTRVVGYRSKEHRRYACLANVLITNSPRSNELPMRGCQFQIQTWHGGGCYKKVGTALNDNMPVTRYITKRQFGRYNLFLSSSRFFSEEVIRNQYCYSGEILECGMPRNDRLVQNSQNERDAIRKELGISNDTMLVLYAPTWRDFAGEAQSLPVDEVRRAFQHRFGKKTMLGVRGHYFSDFSDGSFDCSFDNYRDMQGLLLACDAVITDYSSVIWDFSFTYRPCFLYTPDLAQYERERGFDIDIHEWGFPVCESSDDLTNAICNFDADDFKKKMERHHEVLGSFENGHACEAVAQIIEEHCFGEKGRG